MAPMWIAHVICSGPDCTEELELVTDSLDELERANCECGYGFAVLSVAEARLVEPGGADVLQLRPAAAEKPRREAA